MLSCVLAPILILMLDRSRNRESVDAMKVLIAEDDPVTADFVHRTLDAEGHSTMVVADGRDALALAATRSLDVIVLDRGLPGMDGLAVLKGLRAAGTSTPVLFLTALGSVEDRVEGLMAGADDYLAKPFHHSELAARVATLGRRQVNEVVPVLTLVVHDLELDLMTRRARRGEHEIELKAKEYALLEYLMRNAGRVVTKTMLLERVWNFNFDPQTSVVETHVSRLRAKLDKPFAVPLLHTVRNSGYCLRAPD